MLPILSVLRTYRDLFGGLAFLVCFEIVWRFSRLLHYLLLLCSHFLSSTIFMLADEVLFATITDLRFQMESLLMFLVVEVRNCPISLKKVVLLLSLALE